jgi:hypothetical protein
MKNLLYLLLACAILAGCGSNPSVSVEAVKTAINGHNYSFVDKKNTQVPVYFTNGCVVNLKWDYTMLFRQYDVKEEDGKVLLICGSQAFVASPVAAGGFEFVDAKNGEKIVAAPKANANSYRSLLPGEWTDSYAFVVKDNPEKQPTTPCPGQAGFSVPTVAFADGGSVHSDHCGSKKDRPFILNEATGIIVFDDPCEEGEQWTIKLLTAKEMMVDVRKTVEGKVQQEYGKRFFKP